MERRFAFRDRARVLVSLAGAVLVCAGELAAQQQVLLSATKDGVSGGGESTSAALSADGQVAAFQSTAADLHPGDVDGVPDIYLTSTSFPRPFLASVSSGAQPVKGDAASRLPSLSGDGVRVLFSSDAKNLAADDRNGFTDIFLRDVAAGTTERASLSSAGTEGDDASDRGVLSRNGRFAAFSSRAGNLASPQAPRGTSRIHVRDFQTKSTVRIDLPGGDPADADCVLPDISADGRWVVFQTASTRFGPDRNDFQDIYLHDLLTRRTARVSVAALGAEPDGPSFNPRISAGGRFVAFESLAKNLSGKDRNRSLDVFVRDMHTGLIERVSPDRADEARIGLSDLSDDGRIVLLSTEAALLREDGNGLSDLYARDRIRSTLRLASATFLQGPPRAGSGASPAGAVNGDGSMFAFESTSTDLAPGDQEPGSDVFFLGIGGPRPGPFLPSNHVLLNAAGALRQVDLSGATTGRMLGLAGLPASAVAVDEANALWIAAGRLMGRLEALSLEAPPGEPPFFGDIPGNQVHDLVATRGFAYVAVDRTILRLSPDAEPIRIDLRGSVDTVSLALDPEKRLWASLASAANGTHELLRLSLELRLLGATRRAMADPFREIAVDAGGALILRSRSEIAKLTPAGGLIWSEPLPAGHGVVVDGQGNAYTLAGREVLGFRPDGKLFLRLPHGSAQLPPRSRLLVDGAGQVWVLIDGAQSALIVDPRSTPPRAVQAPPAGGSLGPQPAGDPTGFIAANVFAQAADMDDDGFLDRVETESSFNPLDPRDPPRTRRLLPVRDLTVTPEGNRRVRLSWSSPDVYEAIFVFRDGRQIQGSPFPFASVATGVTDTNVPGGPHGYQVIGQGKQGAGAGAGLGGSTIGEPFSFTTLGSVTLGEGSIRASITVDPAPDAVVHDAASSMVLAVLQGGSLVTLDEDLLFVSEAALPADPFEEAEVRGVAIDAADPSRPLYFLLGDGRIFKKMAAADPVSDVTLTGLAPSPAGFTGLALTDDLFVTMAGPDVDCLIGFLRTSGGFEPGAEQSVSNALGLDVATSMGLSHLGGSLLAGTGSGEAGSSTVNRVMKLELGVAFSLTDGNANVPLGALGSSDIAGFDFAPGLGLIVADRGNGRIAILEATFPGSPQILSITPGSGHFARTTPGVAIEGTGFGFDALDVWVSFDGVSMPIDSFEAGAGRIVISAEAPGHPLAADVEVFTGSGSDLLVPGFIYGFQRGDSNDDGAMDISDAGRVLMYLFAGVTEPPCMDAADADDSEMVELTDAIRVLEFLFMQGQMPPAPFPGHGLDPQGEGLGCGDEP